MMRVFIADDEEIIRDGIRNCIEKEQGRFLFAGEAPDGEMALPMLMEMKPMCSLRTSAYRLWMV